jgi:hypothetical protein
VERQSYVDAAGIPAALLEARRRRGERTAVAPETPMAVTVPGPEAPSASDAPTLF